MKKITQLTLTLIITISQSCSGSFIENIVKKIAYNAVNATCAPHITTAEEKPLLLPLIDASKQASFNYAWQKLFHARSKQPQSLLDSFVAMTIAGYIETVTEDQLKQSTLPHQVADIAWENLELSDLEGLFNLLKKSRITDVIDVDTLKKFEQQFAVTFKSTAVKHAIPYCASIAGAIGSYYIVMPLLKKLYALGQKTATFVTRSTLIASMKSYALQT